MCAVSLFTIHARRFEIVIYQRLSQYPLHKAGISIVFFLLLGAIYCALLFFFPARFFAEISTPKPPEVWGRGLSGQLFKQFFNFEPWLVSVPTLFLLSDLCEERSTSEKSLRAAVSLLLIVGYLSGRGESSCRKNMKKASVRRGSGNVCAMQGVNARAQMRALAFSRERRVFVFGLARRIKIIRWAFRCAAVCE